MIDNLTLINSAVEHGLKTVGFTLTDREKIIVFTIIASITIHEKFKEGEINDKG